MTQKSEVVIEDWYVCFNRSSTKHWVLDMLEPHFQHCFLVKHDVDRWLVVNPMNSHTAVYTECMDEYPCIRALAVNCVILNVTARIEPQINQWHLNVFNCVEVCKSMLGIHDWLLWTPYQLYNRILRLRLCQPHQDQELANKNAKSKASEKKKKLSWLNLRTKSQGDAN
jgi:hypothetical protein